MGRAVGIDLGTTHSRVATVEAGEVIVVPIAEGGRLLPSVVAISKTGERLVGWLAKQQVELNPENTVYSIKRLMGCQFRDSSVQSDMKRLPYKVTEGPNGDVRVIMGGRQYSPPQISAMILHRLKSDAEDYLGEKVTDAVISVPAYFNDSQRQATKDAGTIAGLNVLRIISEPTASSLHYGMHKEGELNLAVYDFGGGTFDVSVLDVASSAFRVKSTNGDSHLGGDDFDNRIVSWICNEFKKECGIDLRQDRIALQRIRDASQKAKHELSGMERTEIVISHIVSDAAGPRHVVLSITRAQFESLVLDLIQKSFDSCHQALADARLSPSQINEVLLVGGTTRIPRVREEVRRFFGKEPRKGIDPDEAVVQGAAVCAGMLTGQVKGTSLVDVTPLTLGIRTLGGEATPVVPRGTIIPAHRSRVFSTANDLQNSIEIQVFQGEHRRFDDNTMLGSFEFVGLPLAHAGVAKIEVSFDIDANSILDISARDITTGKKKEMVITASSGLSREEVEQMALDFEIRSNAETLVHQAKETVQDLKDKLSLDLVKKVEGGINKIELALAGEDTSLVSSTMQTLSEMLQMVRASVPQQKEASPSYNEIPRT
ncbi:MAG TPA: molecular chaperone DnaK [Dehalococcoidia bacterium]|nr:molecular chaperone DnaK [Dehalococcoidia bacterium]